MAGGYQYCSSCKKIEKNMTIFICPDCNKPWVIYISQKFQKRTVGKWRLLWIWLFGKAHLHSISEME